MIPNAITYNLKRKYPNYNIYHNRPRQLRRTIQENQQNPMPSLAEIITAALKEKYEKSHNILLLDWPSLDWPGAAGLATITIEHSRGRDHYHQHDLSISIQDTTIIITNGTHHSKHTINLADPGSLEKLFQLIHNYLGPFITAPKGT